MNILFRSVIPERHIACPNERKVGSRSILTDESGLAVVKLFLLALENTTWKYNIVLRKSFRIVALSPPWIPLESAMQRSHPAQVATMSLLQDRCAAMTSFTAVYKYVKPNSTIPCTLISNFHSSCVMEQNPKDGRTAWRAARNPSKALGDERITRSAHSCRETCALLQLCCAFTLTLLLQTVLPNAKKLATSSFESAHTAHVTLFLILVEREFHLFS